MKKRILTISFMAAGIIILQSSKNGVTPSQLEDRTNSPVNSGNCAGCHSGGVFSATTSVNLLDNTNSVVSSYIPGNTYTIRFNISASSANRFGLQAVVLNGSNSNAGTLAAKSSNVSVTTLNNRQYADHISPSASGLFEATWTAPAKGTGNVTIYNSMLAANGDNSTSGDQAVQADPLVISEQTSAGINILSGLKIYPNPVSEVIYLEGIEVDKIQLFTLDGEMVKSTISENRLIISDIASGQYILTIWKGEEKITKKIIKQ